MVAMDGFDVVVDLSLLWNISWSVLRSFREENVQSSQVGYKESFVKFSPYVSSSPAVSYIPNTSTEMLLLLF